MQRNSKSMFNGLVLNGEKYEAVDVSEDSASICDTCDLQDFCFDCNFDPCDLFKGLTNFRYKED